MTRYEGGGPDEIEANLQTKKGVLPTEFGQTEGMKGAFFLVDRQSGKVVVISLWQDEEALLASVEVARQAHTRVLESARAAIVSQAVPAGAPSARDVAAAGLSPLEMIESGLGR